MSTLTVTAGKIRSNIFVRKPKKMNGKEIVTRLASIFAVALVAAVVINVFAPVGVALAQCVDGADAITGDPCLDIQVDSLMTEIFKWANVIIPILLPLIAIGIGLNFGSSILAGIKNVFNGIKIG